MSWRAKSTRVESNQPEIENLANRPFHFFSQLLTWTSSGKFIDTTEKSALRLKVTCWKLTRIQLLKVAKCYRRLYGGRGGGHKLVSNHTNFCKCSQLYRAISFSLKSYHFEIWKFRQTLFIGVDEFSLPDPYSLKSWKNGEKVYFGSPWRIPP